jgi:hypothetical protein
MPVYALDNARQQTESVGAQTETLLGTTPDGYRPIAQGAYDGFALWCVEVNDPQDWSQIEGFVGRLALSPNRLIKERLVFSSTGNWISWGEGTKVVISTPLSQAFNGEPWVEVASAATCEIWKAASGRVRVTGTTGIESFGTAPAETQALVEFADALTLTHDAGALVLPGGKDVAVAAGDRAFVIYRGGSVSEIVEFMQQSRLESFPVPAAAMQPSPQDGCGDLESTDVASDVPAQWFLPFAHTDEQNAQFSLPVPKGWTGDDPLLSLKWKPRDTDGGDVLWQLRAAVVAAGEAPSAWGDATEFTSAAGTTAGAQRVTARAAVTPDGTPAGGVELYVQVRRAPAEAEDTYLDYADLLSVELTFPMLVTGDR